MSAWKAISHQKVGSGGISSIQFTSIPAIYTDLILYVSGRSTRGNIVSDNIAIRFNDSTSGYTWRRFFGTGSGGGVSDTSSTDRGLTDALTAASASANAFGSAFIYIPNYRSSVAKSAFSDGVSSNNASSSYLGAPSLLWTGTDPITKITIFPWASDSFVQHTSATLYGVTVNSSGGVTVS